MTLERARKATGLRTAAATPLYILALAGLMLPLAACRQKPSPNTPPTTANTPT